jgi:outer membrane protein assembly factor BamD
LFLLGDSFQRQADLLRNRKMVGSPARVEEIKAKVTKQFNDHAAEAYSRIITRYPVSARAEDARRRLAAMNRPIPKATPEAIAQNKAELKGRERPGTFDRALDNFHRRPDVSLAAKTGEPPLTDPKPTSAPQLARETSELVMGKKTAGEASGGLSLEAGGKGEIPPNQPAPRSDTTPAQANDPNAIPELKPLTSDAPSPVPDTTGAGPQPAPPQVNEAAQPNGSPASPQTSSSGSTTAAASADNSSAPTADKDQSTSKKKKKKGLAKIVPF